MKRNGVVMKAVVDHGVGHISLDNVAEPCITASTYATARCIVDKSVAGSFSAIEPTSLQNPG